MAGGISVCTLPSSFLDCDLIDAIPQLGLNDHFGIMVRLDKSLRNDNLTRMGFLGVGQLELARNQSNRSQSNIPFHRRMKAFLRV